ncbi:MAG: GntR family transcriptional regulator [Erysipelotrichales bacterium]
MEWKFNNDRPIYLQLVEKLKILIVTGHFQPNQQMPSVRELATETKVNPNTVQKAYLELEHLELIETRRTNGKFVTDDTKIISFMKNDLALNYTSSYIRSMSDLNYSKEQINDFVRKGEREI